MISIRHHIALLEPVVATETPRSVWHVNIVECTYLDLNMAIAGSFVYTKFIEVQVEPSARLRQECGNRPRLALAYLRQGHSML